MPLKILYNDCYGGFAFSPEYETAYKKRTGKDLDCYKRLFRVGPDSIRCDPDAVALFEELGSEAASGPNASIAVREIPEIFARYWSIEESDGDEYVHVDVNEAYADALHQYMADGFSGHLVIRYSAIKAAAGRLHAGGVKELAP